MKLSHIKHTAKEFVAVESQIQGIQYLKIASTFEQSKINVQISEFGEEPTMRSVQVFWLVRCS